MRRSQHSVLLHHHLGAVVETPLAKAKVKANADVYALDVPPIIIEIGST